NKQQKKSRIELRAKQGRRSCAAARTKIRNTGRDPCGENAQRTKTTLLWILKRVGCDIVLCVRVELISGYSCGVGNAIRWRRSDHLAVGKRKCSSSKGAVIAGSARTGLAAGWPSFTGCNR